MEVSHAQYHAWQFRSPVPRRIPSTDLKRRRFLFTLGEQRVAVAVSMHRRRAQIAAAQPASSEFEDHIAVMLETMRMLVAGDAVRAPAAIRDQRLFFERYLAPWAFECCTAIRDSSVANLYRDVAQFTRCFLALERDSFAMD